MTEFRQSDDFSPTPHTESPQAQPPQAQSPYGQPPQAQPHHAQPPYGQPHQAQSHHAQSPYGQPPQAQPHHAQPPYVQPPQAQPHYAQSPYGQQPPHAQAPYGQPAYGQPPYGQPPYAPPKTAEQERSLRSLTVILYVLYALGLFIGLTSIVAIVVNYIKREDTIGTIYASHFSWQIRTFWWGLFWGVIGALLSVVIVGLFILGIAGIWMIYRLIKGSLNLSDNKPMPMY